MQVNKTTIDTCDEQLEKMLRKLDMEQNKVLLEAEKTKLTTVAEGKEVKCDFRSEKETNKQAQTDDKECNMNREKNNSENDKDDNNKSSNQISEEKHELSDSNIVEDSQNTKQGLNDSNIVEESQNAKQELNDRSIVENSQNDKNKETTKQNLNNITKTTEKITSITHQKKRDAKN